MNRGLLALACGMVALASGACESHDPARPSTTCVVTIPSAQASRIVGPEESTLSLDVTTPAGCAWSAVVSGGFLAITAGTNGTGPGAVTAKASANAGIERVGTITIGAAVARVTQSAAPPPGCAFDVTPPTNTVGPAGGSVAFNVTVTQGANCTWTATSGDTFASVVNGSSGTGNGTVNVNVDANAGAARTATLMIAGKSLAISQDALPAVSCNYSVSPQFMTVGSAGGPLTITVTTGATCSWQPAVIFNLADHFLTVLDPADRKGSGTFRVQAGANQGTSRVNYVHVVGPPSPMPIAIVQDELPGACQIVISPLSFNLSSAEQTITLTMDLVVGTRTLCLFSVGDRGWPNDTFLPVISSRSVDMHETGPSTLQILVPENRGGLRTTTLGVSWGFKLVGNEVFFHHFQGIPVLQNQPTPSCPFTASPAGGAVTSAGGSVTFTLMRQSGTCTPSASTQDSYVTLSPLTQTGPNEWQLTATLAPNPGGFRIAHVIAGGVDLIINQTAR